VHQARRSYLELRSEREKREPWLCEEIHRVWEKSFGGVYGDRKIWRQLKQEGIEVTRCTVERLMQNIDLQGTIPGRAFKGTTPSDDAQAKPQDLVQRDFKAQRPHPLWMVDLTDVVTWKGFAYVAVVIDVFCVFAEDCGLVGDDLTQDHHRLGCIGTSLVCTQAGEEFDSS